SMLRKTIAAAALLTAAFVMPIAPPAHAADAPKVVLALPGVPPIYLTVFAYVADKQGFFKKYNANVEGIYGLPNPDWAIGTTNPKKATCADIKGQQVGIDTPGGARSLALKDMLVGGCHLTINDVQQIPLGSNTAAAMIAGQISYGVLHLNDVPVIE